MVLLGRGWLYAYVATCCCEFLNCDRYLSSVCSFTGIVRIGLLNEWKQMNTALALPIAPEYGAYTNYEPCIRHRIPFSRKMESDAQVCTRQTVHRNIVRGTYHSVEIVGWTAPGGFDYSAIGKNEELLIYTKQVRSGF